MSISPVTQGRELTDITVRLFRPASKSAFTSGREGPVCRSDAVALFCDGEADHLQGLAGKISFKLFQSSASWRSTVRDWARLPITVFQWFHWLSV